MARLLAGVLAGLAIFASAAQAMPVLGEKPAPAKTADHSKFKELAAFFFIHVYLTTTGHTLTAHIKAMITGWEEEAH